jgi:hypothetical protein
LVAAGIATTRYTEGDRAVCKHLDDLFNLPEFEDADKEALALVKKVLKSTCTDVHAQLAFVWIGFVVLTLTTIYLIVLGAKKGNTVSQSLLMTKLMIGMERYFEGI